MPTKALPLPRFDIASTYHNSRFIGWAVFKIVDEDKPAEKLAEFYGKAGKRYAIQFCEQVIKHERQR